MMQINCQTKSIYCSHWQDWLWEQVSHTLHCSATGYPQSQVQILEDPELGQLQSVWKGSRGVCPGLTRVYTQKAVFHGPAESAKHQNPYTTSVA